MIGKMDNSSAKKDWDRYADRCMGPGGENGVCLRNKNLRVSKRAMRIELAFSGGKFLTSKQ